MASIGLSVELAQQAHRGDEAALGPARLCLAALRVLRRLRRFTAELVHEGRIERVRAVQVAVGNGRHYGGGMTVAARTALDDGLLHGYSLEVRHWWQLLALVPALRRGRYDAWREVRSFVCCELEVRTRRPRPVNADGEIITTTPARFRVHPGAVRVYAPSVGRD